MTSLAATSSAALMQQALHLAKQGWFTTRTNPRVGCVLVNQGKLVGTGAHLYPGSPHAEVHALNQAGSLAQGATAYVTLEPCSHQGLTGPCANALIEAGVAKVVIAGLDPNPQVAGKGKQLLEDAGIEVVTGLLEEEALALNPGFYQRMQTGLPRISLKLAASLDGKTALANGESQWITSPQAREDVQKLRAASCAIITGADSVLHDNSQLNVRKVNFTSLEGFQQPLRVVVDSQLRLPKQAKILQVAGRCLIATLETTLTSQAAKAEELKQAGATLIGLPANTLGKVCLTSLAKHLAQEEKCNEVLLETGARLAGAFVKAGLVNQLYLYLAPKLLGSAAKGLINLPVLTQLTQAPQLSFTSGKQLGPDWRFELEFRS